MAMTHEMIFQELANADTIIQVQVLEYELPSSPFGNSLLSGRVLKKIVGTAGPQIGEVVQFNLLTVLDKSSDAIPDGPSYYLSTDLQTNMLFEVFLRHSANKVETLDCFRIKHTSDHSQYKEYLTAAISKYSR